MTDEGRTGGIRCTCIRIFLKSFFCTSSSSPEASELFDGSAVGVSLSPLFSFSGSVVGRESLPNRVWAICSTIPSKVEMMMAASRVSLNTMKKIGTENTFGMAALGSLGGQTTTSGRESFGRRGDEGKRRTSGEPVWCSGSITSPAWRPGRYQIKKIIR